MENASKALLIAGAILIAIVLISVGMLVLNSTTDVTDQVGDVTTSQAAQAFNSRFIPYAGIQKGSAVKALLGEIAASNKTNGSGHSISVTGDILSAGYINPSQLLEAMSNVVNSANYKVKMSATSSGYITVIEIIKQ